MVRDDKPLVSVVIPTYNRRELVCQTIDTVLTQDWHPLEVVVVDDGSEDGTAEHVRARYGDRLRVLRQPNSGPAAARNLGLQHANGELLVTIDSDDLMAPNGIRVRVETLTAQPHADGCYGLKISCRDGSAPATFPPKAEVALDAADDLLAAYIRRPFFHHSELMLRRHVLPPDAQLFDPLARCLEDFLMIVRVLCRHTMVACPHVVTLMRDVARQDRQRYNSHAVLAQGLAPAERLLADSRLAERLGPLAGEVYGHFLQHLANASWRTRRGKEFRRHLVAAWRVSSRLRNLEHAARYVGSFLLPLFAH
jgi:glycosyltransferase involved in cell wall biosynthesis